MKKTLMLFAAILMITGLYAQSVQWHQSYDNNQKFVADFFWSNEKFNVYSYNEFTVSKNQAVGYGIIYGEYRIAKSHFLTHLEARFRTRDFNGNIPSAMYYPDNNLTNIGFAYELCAGEHWFFYFTPMYRWDYGNGKKGSNWQFSINSSADYNKFYYEGYLDMWGPTTFNLCTEQKFYYKIIPNLHIGVNLMLFNVNDKSLQPMSVRGDGQWNFQPWAVLRVAL